MLKLLSPRRLFVMMAIVPCVLVIAAQEARAQGSPTVISGSGDVTPVIDLYRKLLGEPNNAGIAGTQPGGRREINWDGVPDDQAAPAMLPGDFFRARGAILQTPGRGVQVSAKAGNPSKTRPNFAHINPTYEKIFKPFSGERMFSPIGSNVVNLTFVVPGSKTPAAVRGFGAVYIDTDLPHTSFQYFARNGRSLGTFPVPVMNEGFSFLGVIFDQAVVARVRIEYGTTALGPNDDPRRRRDVSVMDDFIFGEPQEMK
jgi:hypothetical protein